MNEDFEIDQTTVTGYCGFNEKVVIPPGITAIREEAFRGDPLITSIHISSTVKEIGSCAMAECENLEEVFLLEGLNEIGAAAFSETAIRAVTLPSTLQKIGDCAFSGTKLQQVDIPRGVKTVESQTFEGCYNLERVVLNEGTIGIGGWAFHGCSNLTTIEIPDSVCTIERDAFDGCINIKWILATDSWKRRNQDLLYTILKNSTPSVLKSYVGEKTACFCMEKNVLTDYFGGAADIIIPAKVHKINSRVFQNNASLHFVDATCVNSVIGWGAFDGCTSLTKVSLSDDLREIGGCAFQKTNLLEIQLPQKLERLGTTAFYGTPIGNIQIPGGVTEISAFCFSFCKGLQKVELCNGVQAVEMCAFSYCTGLEEITIPDSVQRIHPSAFKRCHITKVICSAWWRRTFPDLLDHILHPKET